MVVVFWAMLVVSFVMILRAVGDNHDSLDDYDDHVDYGDHNNHDKFVLELYAGIK